jgi:hypothetical protein
MDASSAKHERGRNFTSMMAFEPKDGGAAMFIVPIILAFTIAFVAAFLYKPQPRAIRIRSRQH